MDLLGDHPAFDLKDNMWRIYSRNTSQPPHHVGNHASISNSLITEGCDIEGIVENSVLFCGVKVEQGAYIKDSVIMSSVTVKRGATVNFSIIDSNTVIGEDAVIGRSKGSEEDITVIGTDLEISSGFDIPGGSLVNQAWLDKHNSK